MERVGRLTERRWARVVLVARLAFVVELVVSAGLAFVHRPALSWSVYALMVLTFIVFAYARRRQLGP